MTFFALLAIVIGVLSALGLVLVGLLEMPWPLLLIALLATLYGFQRLMGAETEVLALGEQADRAATESAVAKPATSSPGGFSDQGSSEVDIRVAASQAAAQSDVLIYRGVRYRVGGSAKVDRPGP